MSAYVTTPGLVANGNIGPALFVMIDVSGGDFYCLQATGNARTIGISQVGTRDAPGLSGSSVNAAIAGDAIEIFGIGMPCLLTLGTGGCTRGDLLESDANGAGVTSSVSGHAVGAIALETGAAAAMVRVIPVMFKF